MGGGAHNHGKVYVGGLHPDTTERDIHDAFDRCGAVRSVQLKRGFAFVEYNESRSCDDAVRELVGREILGSRISVERAGGSRGSRVGGKGSMEKKPGDWECPSCGANNFASRVECFKCGVPKPASAEASRYSEHDRRNQERSRDRDDDRDDDRGRGRDRDRDQDRHDEIDDDRTDRRDEGRQSSASPDRRRDSEDPPERDDLSAAPELIESAAPSEAQHSEEPTED